MSRNGGFIDFSFQTTPQLPGITLYYLEQPVPGGISWYMASQ